MEYSPMAAARKSKSPINQPRYRINLTLKALTIPSEADPNRTFVSGAVQDARPSLASVSRRRRPSASGVAGHRVRHGAAPWRRCANCSWSRQRIHWKGGAGVASRWDDCCGPREVNGGERSQRTGRSRSPIVSPTRRAFTSRTAHAAPTTRTVSDGPDTQSDNGSRPSATASTVMSPSAVGAFDARSAHATNS